MRAPGIAVVVSLVVLAAGAGYAGYRLYDYSEHDPKFCASCHIMHEAWDAWAAGDHKDVTCKTCHRQDIVARARIVWSWTRSQVEDVPPHTRLDRSVCEECHMARKKQWKQVADSVGHMQHVVKADLQCLACHLPSLHAVEPKVEDCQRCHADSKINIGAMEGFHCTTCHNFRAHTGEAADIEPHREQCLECHRGMQVGSETFAHDGPMAFECSQCHKPHTRPFLQFSDCLACHPEVARSRAHFEHRALLDCTSCHKPHSWKAAGWARAGGAE